jgi:site-specific DNA recombinase
LLIRAKPHGWSTGGFGAAIDPAFENHEGIEGKSALPFRQGNKRVDIDADDRVVEVGRDSPQRNESIRQGCLVERALAAVAQLDALDNEPPNGLGQSQLIKHGRQIAEELSTKTPSKAKATLMALRCRVTIYPDRIELALCRGSAAELLAGHSAENTAQHQRSDPLSRDVMTLRVSARLKRVGGEMRILVEGADDQTAANPSLLRVIARAHDIHGRLCQTDLTVHNIAREERVTAAYIYTLLRLPWLAPDITTAIVNGRQPQQLSAKTLMRKASRLPADWTEQRTLLGF